MSSCCSEFCSAADGQFSTRRAESDLKGYRRKGPNPTTRLIRDLVRDAGGGRTLLDIGGGIGALTFELMSIGFSRATILDASRAFVDAARSEVDRRGQSARISVEHGDFAAAGGSIPQADVVVMDRVICCYPSYPRLLGEALEHSRHLLGLSYPQDRWYVRLAIGMTNAIRAIRRNPFRVFVHPAGEMREYARRMGFTCTHRTGTFSWVVELYTKGDGSPNPREAA